MDKIRIGYINFAIQPFPLGFAANLDGKTDFTNQIIYIDEILSPEAKACTLLHEVLHVIWALSALHDDDKEERIVTALGNGLSQVIRDNPEFATFIKKRLN